MGWKSNEATLLCQSGPSSATSTCEAARRNGHVLAKLPRLLRAAQHNVVSTHKRKQAHLILPHVSAALSTPPLRSPVLAACGA